MKIFQEEAIKNFNKLLNKSFKKKQLLDVVKSMNITPKGTTSKKDLVQALEDYVFGKQEPVDETYVTSTAGPNMLDTGTNQAGTSFPDLEIPTPPKFSDLKPPTPPKDFTELTRAMAKTTLILENITVYLKIVEKRLEKLEK